jgi:hypothetical protein
MASANEGERSGALLATFLPWPAHWASRRLKDLGISKIAWVRPNVRAVSSPRLCRPPVEASDGITLFDHVAAPAVLWAIGWAHRRRREQRRDSSPTCRDALNSPTGLDNRSPNSVSISTAWRACTNRWKPLNACTYPQRVDSPSAVSPPTPGRHRRPSPPAQATRAKPAPAPAPRHHDKWSPDAIHVARSASHTQLGNWPNPAAK